MPIESNGTHHCALYLDTIRLLKNRPQPLTLKKISEDTGLPAPWLFSILAQPDLSPSVDRVVKLYEYLKGSPLAL